MSKYKEGYERIFGKDKKVEPGRWMTHPETGELVDRGEYWRFQAMIRSNMFGRAPMIIKDIRPYHSPINGREISGRRAQRYDLESNQCRIYEGRDQEQKEVNRYHAEQDRNYEASLDKALRETANDLKYQNVEKQDHIKSAWILGEDA